MTKRISVLLVCLMLMVAMVSGCSEEAENQEQSTAIAGSATEEMTEASYWKGTDKVVMTEDRIREYNEKNLNTEGTNLFDLLGSDTTIEASKVKKMIENYDIESYFKYADNEEMTKEMKKSFRASRNIDALGDDTINIQYGVITEPTNVRGIPTDKALTSNIVTEENISNGVECDDYGQQTRFRLGEGVWIYHKSADSNYYFVQGKNYNGWVKRVNVGLCSKEELNEYLQDENFIVTTQREITTVNDKEMNLSIGTKFLLDDAGKIKVPIKENSEQLGFKTVDSLDIDCTTKGYLSYTTNNLYKVALSLLGDRYDWGGKDGYYDCSDMIVAIYSAFGIDLPRDTYNMECIKDGDVDIKEEGYLESLQPGALLIQDNHVMMYMGYKNGHTYVIHNFAGYENENGEKVILNKTVLSSIDDIYRLREEGEDRENFEEAIISVKNVK